MIRDATHTVPLALPAHAFCWVAAAILARTQTTLSELLTRRRSIFLTNDRFVFANRVMQHEPGIANCQNRGCSSEREFAFRGQGFAVVEVCHALLEVLGVPRLALRT